MNTELLMMAVEKIKAAGYSDEYLTYETVDENTAKVSSHSESGEVYITVTVSK